MIGQILQKALKDANIPAAEAASFMGISEGNLYRLFKKDSFEVSYLKKAAELLKIPISHFFQEDGVTNMSISQTGTTTQTGDFNQAGQGNNQKIKVSKGGESIQEIAAQLQSCQRELALTQALVAAHQETISLLRGSYNRPN